MKDPLQIRELGWRQDLTEAQQAELKRHLAAYPELAADWEAEQHLTRLLEKLPDAPPVASNFTAQVIQAIRADARAASRPVPNLLWRLRAWLPRIAVASLAVAIGFLAVRERQAEARQVMAQRVATVAQAVPDADLMRNFGTISRLADEPPKADTDLLALMQ